MKYLHTMLRVTDLAQSRHFFCDVLGLRELRRTENEKGRYTLVFLAAPGDEAAQVELTYNWDAQSYSGGRNFGHLAYEVEDIYATCARLMQMGVTINRHAMAGWRSYAHPTASPSNCCSGVKRCRRRSPGCRCRTSASGSQSHLGALDIVCAAAAHSRRGAIPFAPGPS